MTRSMPTLSDTAQTAAELIALITNAANELARRSKAANVIFQAAVKAGTAPRRPAVHIALEDAAMYNALFALTGCEELYDTALELTDNEIDDDPRSDVAFDYYTGQASSGYYS